MAMDTPQKTFPPFADEAAVTTVIEGFRARSLPFAHWSHQAHLAVGLWHVATFGEDAAKVRLRDGISAYNVAVGRVNDDKRGYHETVTFYFAWAAARHLDNDPGGSLVDRVNRFVASPLGGKEGIFRFWSRESLFTPRARLGWLEPDLRPLDAAVLMAPAQG